MLGDRRQNDLVCFKLRESVNEKRLVLFKRIGILGNIGFQAVLQKTVFKVVFCIEKNQNIQSE